MGRNFWPVTVIGAMFAFGLGWGHPAFADVPGGTLTESRTVPASATQIQLSYAPLVRQVAPSVVNVYAKRIVRTQASPFMNDPFFRQFFGGNLGMPRERVERSLGSGVIVDPSGVIVTNNHVVQGGQELTVALSDRREFKAKVLLADERTDLAVLKIEPNGKPLPALAFGNSDKAEVGDLVLAIGNPFGVGQTVTSGIVSATSRTNVGVSDYQFFIQTDAAINPGNSGGALVTMDGRLIGINSSILSQSGGSVGIGFAIPSNMVRQVVTAAENGKDVARPWLGATMQPVTQDIADNLGLERPVGALISSVYPDGPAARAGLQLGDVILSVDGFEIDDPQAVLYRFATSGVGHKAQIAYARKSSRASTLLALETPPARPAADQSELTGKSPFAGATVANLSPAMADRMGFDDLSVKGVVVVSVRDGSAAEQVQFQAGDIIEILNGTAINSVQDLKAAIATTGRTWSFTINRNGREMTATLRG